MSRKDHAPKRSILATAILAATLLPAAAFAQEETSTDPEAKSLEKVTVTGSLIPQTELETFVPVTIITAEDIRARGFSSVAEVLQKSSFATGGVQGAQTSPSFTQGAEAVSLFGLPPGYVKYLIDGRPMANYPALYNGSDTFNNISGIPIDLVDRIEILPGGQSSLYGSDAIAGVINVILKKKLDGAVMSVRGGTYTEGGGNTIRFTFADGWTSADGRSNVLGGVQYEERDPIWGYQRDITKQYNQHGYTPPLASRDFLVTSPFTSYKFLDPNNCENVSGLFGGTMELQSRPGFGDGYYCGSMYTPGYRTLMNGKKSGQAYVHGTFDVNDNVQLYGDVLYSHDEVKYHVGSNYTWWGTGVDFGYYYDPNVDDLLNLQRTFAPEEMGGEGFGNTMSKDTSNSLRVTFGAQGTFGGSDWEYDIGGTYTEYRLTENSFSRFADQIDQFFIDKVLGPQIGVDPYGYGYPAFSPDYAAFYSPITPQEFNSFTGYVKSRSETSDSMLRMQLTNGTLFSLPGGDAGLAVVGEIGHQKWDYSPDERYLDGSVWGSTAVAGSGDRDRYALTSELRLPIFEPLTITASGRYDAFEPDGGSTVDKTTYSLGVEYRPFKSLLIRGKYGTAFRAPTLSDQFQGTSGFYTYVADYYQCSLAGYSPEQVDDCPSQYSSRQVFGTQSGNLDLEPIDADVWSAGVVWAPVDRMSLTVDYHNWDISNEVTQQSTSALTLQEYRCRTGVDDINSPLCTNTLAQVTRNAQGNITEIYTPKINVSKRKLEAVTAAFNYGYDFGTWGDLNLRTSFTQNLKHEYTQYDGDEPVDLVWDPYWTTDPRRKANGSLTWSKGQVSATWYTNWIDKTPNYRAWISTAGYDAPLAHRIGSYTTHNLSVSWKPIDALELSIMSVNLFNKMPPYDYTYPGSSGAPYQAYNFDPYGRAIYAEMRYSFGN